jgi:nucleoside-diphosphate-sugar epimerase
MLCDVMDTDQITKAMTDISCIIHTAYGSKEVTVQGTKNMLDCAHRLGVRKFIHLSTTEVYGDVSGDIDETFPLQSTGSEYCDSKIEAEKLCWDYHSLGLPVTVIRPPIVFGPFGRTWTIELATKLQSGNWNVLNGYGDGICNLIYIEDLVSGIMLAIQNSNSVGEAINLSGPEVITWNEYFQGFNTALGLSPLKMKSTDRTKLHALYMEPIRNIAKIGVNYFGNQIRTIGKRYAPVKRVLRSVEKYIKTVPRLADLDLYGRDAIYVSTKAKDILGFTPNYSIEFGLELTARWLKHIGLLV